MATTDRGELMFKLARLVEENKETLATIETWDNGKLSLWIFEEANKIQNQRPRRAERV